ncbi:hypothetical protein PAXRUDRAFT_143470 [Paxillus rubicundulus Ve08.2h10]|uniref:HAT C-terminal dimerisation domain-containing protein n=1 Tax=Paxillus rubicundulus Ve08.2h10 TaxID=930991 RepID=A0A0D0E1H1_9AGAM|nr:hypothetical protein PAXRUDRAFT_143470 [Paxillus rubicundulus Ve08.2h10]
MAWGGPEEQQKEQAASNPNAKDWHAEALKTLKQTMEECWNDWPVTDEQSKQPTSTTENNKNDILESEFDCHCHELLQKTMTEIGNGGWRAELHHYLSDLPSNVSKDTDIVEWWSNHSKIFPILACMAMDICAIPATSISCECLFSASAEITTDCHSCLGSDKFEHLQVMKHTWLNSITDHAAINSAKVDKVYLQDFRELLMMDCELAACNEAVDEVVAV